MWNLKRTNKNDSKWKETHRFRERTYGYRREIWGKGTVREFGVDMYTLVYLKQIANKDLLHSTWDSVRCYLAA